MTTPSFENVAVMGAGAVGCYFGAMLARAGAQVRLIGRPALVEAVQPGRVGVFGRLFKMPLDPFATPHTARAPRPRPVLVTLQTPPTQPPPQTTLPPLP